MRKHKREQEEIGREIARLGQGILCSSLFRKGFSQTHHKITTVGDHTLNVTICGDQISRFLERRGKSVNRANVVQGALLHDVGIIGRDEKYRDNHECGQRHAADSAVLSKELLPEVSPEIIEIVEHHMFPVTKIPPKSREGRIVVFADKYCAVMEWLGFLSGQELYHTAKRAIRKAIPQIDIPPTMT